MKKFYTFLFLLFLSNALILQAQNVGVGEDTPNSKLEIKGDSGTDLLNVKDQNDVSRLYIKNDGNVGIGTPNPSEKLHLRGSNGSTGYPTIRLENTSGHTWHIWPIDGNDLRIRDVTDGADRLTIEGITGDVGIGTADPTSRLDVNGNLRVRSLGSGYLESDASGNITHTATIPWSDISGTPTISGNKWNGSDNVGGNIYRSGNVGIGTTTPPTNKLELVGGVFHIEKPDFGFITMKRTGFGDETDWLISPSSNFFTGFGGDALRIRANGTDIYAFGADGNFGATGTGLFENNLYVDENVGIGTRSPSTQLEVISDPTSANSVAIRAEKDGNAGGSNYHTGVIGRASGHDDGGWYRGVYGNATRGTANTSGRTYGVYGVAGNATNGFNYGVYGQLSGSNNGAAVYGSVNGFTTFPDINTGGRWAGFFNGDVNLEGGLGIDGDKGNNGDVLTSDGTNLSWSNPNSLVNEEDPTWNGAANETGDIGRNGAVGIGTTNPLSDFHVNGFSVFGNGFTPSTTEAENILNLIIGINSSGESNGIAFYENTGGFGMKLGYDGAGSGDANALRFYDNNDASIVTIQNGGNLGIGMDDPSMKLSVEEVANGGLVNLSNVENGDVMVIGSSDLGGGESRSWFAPAEGGAVDFTKEFGYDPSLASNDGAWYFENNVVMASNTGNVGIGNTDPQAKLHVTDGGAGPMAQFHAYGNANPSVTIESENNAPGMGVLKLQQASNNTDRVVFTANSGSYWTADAGNVSIGTSDNGMSPLVVENTSSWSLSGNTDDIDNLYLENHRGGGENGIGGSISFSGPANGGGNDQRRHAAITGIQTDSETDYVGLAFFTHNNITSTANMQESMRLTHDGRLLVLGDNPGATNIDNQTFEAQNFGNWTQSTTDDDDWQTNSGGTTSSNTGPSSASGGTYYAYTETSGSAAGDVYQLDQTVDLSGVNSATLSFDYHMYFNNASDGNLSIIVNGNTVWSVTGSQQATQTDPWLTAGVSLADYAGQSNVAIQIRFTSGSQTSTFHYDCALDNIEISTNSGEPTLLVGSQGDGTFAQANTWSTFSDKRWKEDFENIPDVLKKIEKINGYYYKWKDREDKTRQLGVVAQEIQKEFPEIVSKNADGYLSVDYSKLTAPLIEAVKQLNKKVEDQSKEMEALKAQVNENQKMQEDIEALKEALQIQCKK